MEKSKKRMQELAGILKESTENKKEESGFKEFEFENDLQINEDNKDLFNELEDPKN